jgi:hypothetical protein
LRQRAGFHTNPSCVVVYDRMVEQIFRKETIWNN